MIVERNAFPFEKLLGPVAVSAAELGIDIDCGLAHADPLADYSGGLAQMVAVLEPSASDPRFIMHRAP